MADNTGDRGPNGIPYVEPDRTDIGKWESGDYRLRLGRCDGEVLNLNFKPKHFHALLSGILYAIGESGDGTDSTPIDKKVETYNDEVVYTVRVKKEWQ